MNSSEIPALLPLAIKSLRRASSTAVLKRTASAEQVQLIITGDQTIPVRYLHLSAHIAIRFTLSTAGVDTLLMAAATECKMKKFRGKKSLQSN
jgi:hypothetical protein